jgi:hypothetical protein
MVGVQQWRNDPDRPFRNIRRNKHGSRSKKLRPLDGSKPNSAGPMQHRRWANLSGRWPTDDPVRNLHQRWEIVSAIWHNRCPDRCHGEGAPSDAARQAWDTNPEHDQGEGPRARSTPSSASTGSSTAMVWRSHGCGRGAARLGLIGSPGRSTRHVSANWSSPGVVGSLAARLHAVSKPRDPGLFRTGSGPACP